MTYDRLMIMSDQASKSRHPDQEPLCFFYPKQQVLSTRWHSVDPAINTAWGAQSYSAIRNALFQRSLLMGGFIQVLDYFKSVRANIAKKGNYQPRLTP